MDRLLKLKKPITEYLKAHPNNTRKLSTNEWLITREVCSLLDPVAEVTTRIQGTEGTFLSQAILLMTELLAVLEDNSQEIRSGKQANDGTPMMEDTEVDELTAETQTTRTVLIDTMAKKELGSVSISVEGIALLLDPRYKHCSDEVCRNGGAALKLACMGEINAGIADFFVSTTKPVSVLKSPRCEVDDGSRTPAPAAKKVRLSRLHQRRVDRLQAASRGGHSPGNEGGRADAQPKDLLREELAAYVAERPEVEDDNFSLLRYWARRAIPTVTTDTKEVVLPAKSPHLALVARLFHAIGATSCQAEMSFSGLSLLIGDLRTTMSATKVEQMMFLRLNQENIPEVRTFMTITRTSAAIARKQQELAAETKKAVEEMQTAAAGQTLEIFS